MAKNDELFDPEAGFIVTTADDWTHFDAATFTTFYQPILGALAFATFWGLRSQLHPQPTIADRQLQSSLLTQLNIGRQAITEGLNRLEGVGMLRTFRQTDSLGVLNVYQLQATLTPRELINDDLLSVLLLETVGDDRFEHLIKVAQRYELGGENHLTEVSHHFLDVFQIDQTAISKKPTVIADAQKQLPQSQRQQLQVRSADFDWPTLVQLLNNQPITEEDLAKHRNLIEVEHQLYGIDEPTMSRLLVQTISLANNQINPAALKKVIAQTYSQPATVHQNRQSTEENSSLTDEESQLLKACSYYAPIDFLQQLKQQTGGYVTSGERYLLQQLVGQNGLDTEVVNVLIWYVIASLGNATLPKGLVDTIANNWLKAGVTDATSAMKQIKAFNSQASTKPKKRSTRRRVVKEKMPEWSKNTQKRSEKSSPEVIERLKARIAEHNHRKEDADS